MQAQCVRRSNYPIHEVYQSLRDTETFVHSYEKNWK